MTPIRIRKAIFLLALVGIAASSAPAEDLGFRFSKKEKRCVNGRGEAGYNPGYRGECGGLKGADLKGADLQKANLEGADLSDADLREADLSRANLWSATLRGADLRGAKLNGATLVDANLEGANLEGADLEEAVVNEKTLLPFSRDEAASRMMRIFTTVNAPKVLKQVRPKYPRKARREKIEGTVLLSSDTIIIEVRAVGDWTIEVATQ